MNSGRLLPVLIAGTVFLFDRVTKMWIESRLTVWDSWSIIPGFFDLVHTKNRGAAFGMFADSTSEWRTILLIGVSLAVLVLVSALLLRPSRGGFASTPRTIAGLSLVLGGALGNMYDRIVYGMVTDFLEFYLGEWRFAAFNVADSAITCGAGLLILEMWMSRKQPVRS